MTRLAARRNDFAKALLTITEIILVVATTIQRRVNREPGLPDFMCTGKSESDIFI